MKTLVDVRLTREAAEFAFRFACGDCVHRCEHHGCAHGYPEPTSRGDLEKAELVFCKEFEFA